MQDRIDIRRPLPDAVAAYREANGIVPQTFFIMNIFVAHALFQQGGADIDTLTVDQQCVLANTMSGAHVAKGRRIPVMGDTPLGHSLNNRFFHGNATIVPLGRMQELFAIAHKGALRIIQQGKQAFGDSGEEKFSDLLDKILQYLHSDEQTKMLCDQYTKDISTGFGVRHTSDGYRMLKAAYLKHDLRQRWLTLLQSHMAEENQFMAFDFINIILPWHKEDVTLTGLS